MVDDLAEVTAGAREIGQEAGQQSTVVVVFFDLVESTARKMQEGHTAGTRAAVVHNEICRIFTERFSGRVIKELGDGLLATFNDPAAACCAALNARAGVERAGLQTKVGLTLGVVEEIQTALGVDALGATIDRAARLQALALPRQIIADQVIIDAAGTVLRDFDDVTVSQAVAVQLKGVGEVTVFEMSDATTGFVGVTSHFGLFEDAVISPVDARRFPPATDPAKWLVCDVCGEPVAPDGHDANIVLDEERDKCIRSVRLVHRESCDDGSGRWIQLEDLANPIQYVSFVTSTLNRLANRQMTLQDSSGFVKVLIGMYRQVFRPSTQAEELDFATDEALKEMGM